MAFPTAVAAGRVDGLRRGRNQREAAARRAAGRLDAAVRELAAVSRRLLPADGERTEQWREQVLAAARHLVAERAAALTEPHRPPDEPQAPAPPPVSGRPPGRGTG